MQRRGRPIVPIPLNPETRRQLESMSRSPSLPLGLARRAKIVLLAADQKGQEEVAKQVGLSRTAVSTWLKRFRRQGLMGLYDEMKPGKPRSISDEKIQMLIRRTLEKKPKDATQWTLRSVAAEVKLSKSTVHRIWSAFHIQPHRQKHFKLSNDPFFVDKVRDIVGLYLSPPDQALVLCVDEKSQIQALNRTQPILPMGLGYVQGVTHDYVRHGTTTLFAAFDIVSGQVVAQCHQRHRHQEFLRFLNYVDQNVPKELDVHLVVDNYSTHKHPKVRRWLGARSRYHVHYTPTYASWLNQVEIWFNIITQKAIRRGSFRSVKELIGKIKSFVDHYNRTSKSFMWTATADSILAKTNRLCKVISGTPH